uniref:Uncharacterized protein n=1 Tax=Arundo donax TaxID=35708 RepID=A0A0A9HRA2_ARUDO
MKKKVASPDSVK